MVNSMALDMLDPSQYNTNKRVMLLDYWKMQTIKTQANLTLMELTQIISAKI